MNHSAPHPTGPGRSRSWQIAPSHIMAALSFALLVGASDRTAADAGTRLQLGVVERHPGFSLDRVALNCEHCYDYTFTGAPTDWVPRGGLWEMTGRWDCDQRWSFYGGFGEGPVVIWNKRRFAGDVTVEAYLAFKRGLGNYSHYKHPNDLNIALCGDGANLDSGYTFMFGGDLNRRTAILRKGVTLAETRDRSALLPIFEDNELSTTGFHRRWWRLKAERVGSKLTLWLDGRRALTAEDPQPLQAGRVAIWTLDNGIVVSRVRINYEREERDAPPGIRYQPAANARRRASDRPGSSRRRPE
ncbi:MAG: hypothetical protein ACE5O2_15625 [Armatimonadota bacterium]